MNVGSTIATSASPSRRFARIAAGMPMNDSSSGGENSSALLFGDSSMPHAPSRRLPPKNASRYGS